MVVCCLPSTPHRLQQRIKHLEDLMAGGERSLAKLEQELVQVTKVSHGNHWHGPERYQLLSFCLLVYRITRVASCLGSRGRRSLKRKWRNSSGSTAPSSQLPVRWTLPSEVLQILRYTSSWWNVVWCGVHKFVSAKI